MDAFAILCSILAPSRIKVGAYGDVRVPTVDTVHPRGRLLQRRARLLFSRYVLAGMARCCIAGPQIPLCPGTCPGFSRLTEFGCQKAAPTRSMHFPSDLASVHTITAHIRAEIHDAPLLLPAQLILRRVTSGSVKVVS